MSYRRGIFIKNAAKFLDISEENVIVINMEKGIFNLTIEICKNNKESDVSVSSTKKIIKSKVSDIYKK